VNELTGISSSAWPRVVGELAAPAPTDRDFLTRMLGVLAQVSGARQVVAWRGGGDAGPTPVQVWAETRARAPGVSVSTGAGVSVEHALRAVESADEQRSACRAALDRARAVAFGLDDEGLYDGTPGRGSVLALPLPAADPASPLGVTLLVEPRSRPALQTTLAVVELTVGYAHHHAASRALARSRSAAAALDLAAGLIAGINQSAGFRGAAMQTVNDLCRRMGLDRAAIGWSSRGGFCRVVALSDTEHVDRRLELVRKLESALDECVDQEQAVLYPPPGPAEGPDQSDASADPMLARAIARSHAALAGGDPRLSVGSVPMRSRGSVVGALVFESAGEQRPDTAAVERLQAVMDLVTPVLEIRKSDDRTLAGRAWASLLKGAAWVVGARHTAWKLGLLTGSAALLAAALVPVPYRVGAGMELLPAEPRTVSMPFEGVIASLGPAHRAGDAVRAGDVLMNLDTTEQELSRLDILPEITRFEKQADEALKLGRTAEAQRATAQADQARARLALIERRLADAVVVSPVTGRIVSGDVREKAGAAVRQGEVLLTVADTSALIVEARVEDRDIGLIREGGRGTIATAAEPGRRLPFTVERIVPQAQTDQTRNVFRVRARLEEPAAWLRPGMQGRARFEVDRRSPLRIAARRLVDAACLWVWW
jgi:hypothetical protein